MGAVLHAIIATSCAILLAFYPARAERPENRPVKELDTFMNDPRRDDLTSRLPANAGEFLHIPEAAARNRDVSFLEGCWLGTRPEMYSKRTVRECFCFNSNGGEGLRVLFDDALNSICRGTSRARISSDGTLLVSSSPAPCSDGGHFTAMEMACGNFGGRARCAWVSGPNPEDRQEYEIPLVRVDSCGEER